MLIGLSMSNPISLNDVAKAAGVSISAVSLVMNGKADQRRISPSTQARIRAAASQLGYQPNWIARNTVLRKRAPQPLRETLGEKSPLAVIKPVQREIGLILSAASSADSLGLIPGLAPILDTADYRLIIVTVPSDPVTARARVIRFLADNLTGILCCPTVYPAVLATVAEACPDPGSRVPVIVLCQGAGLAMLKAVGQPQVDAPVAHSGKAPASVAKAMEARGAVGRCQ
jgi:DNA-binding LacI/PurR family transcriptional regulator